jgi:hypothetical protein
MPRLPITQREAHRGYALFVGDLVHEVIGTPEVLPAAAGGDDEQVDVRVIACRLAAGARAVEPDRASLEFGLDRRDEPCDHKRLLRAEAAIGERCHFRERNRGCRTTGAVRARVI